MRGGAQAKLGYRACVCRIPNEATWASIAVPLGTPFAIRAAKYSLPARADARLPAVFVDSNAFPLHHDFMRESFPDLFGGLTTRDYLAMIQDARQRRKARTEVEPSEAGQDGQRKPGNGAR